jgi:hypothetical protein
VRCLTASTSGWRHNPVGDLCWASSKLTSKHTCMVVGEANRVPSATVISRQSSTYRSVCAEGSERAGRTTYLDTACMLCLDLLLPCAVFIRSCSC